MNELRNVIVSKILVEVLDKSIALVCPVSYYEYKK